MISAQWDVSEQEFTRIIENMQFQYFKWDSFVNGKLRIIPEAIIIDYDECQQAITLCKRVNQILSILENKLRRDRTSLIRLGIPERVADLILIEPPSTLQLTRYDLFRTEEGAWQLTEFNEDVPGGFNEAIGIPALLARHYNQYSLEDCFSKKLLEALPDDEGATALMYATGYSDDLQHMAVLEKLLSESGRDAILCSPSQLRLNWGKPYINKTKISSIIRFYPGEWYGILPNYKVWKKALGKVPMLNPISRLIRQSKNLFALWNTQGLLEDSDREFLQSVTPETIYFSEVSHRFLDFPKHDWVLKHAFGRMGDTVTMGSLTKDLDWEKAWHEAQKKPLEFTLQRRFSVEPLAFKDQAMYPTLGVYLINGEFAGFYSRTAETPFLTHEAYYVPTLVKLP